MRRTFTALVLLLAVAAGGCEDDFGRLPFGTIPDTVSLYSLTRLEHVGLPSAFNFAGVTSTQPVVVEAPNNTGQWDIVVMDPQDLVFAPAGYLQGMTVTPALARIGNETFADLDAAPSGESAYNDSTPELLAVGDIFVVRTRQLRTCVYYAKLQVIDTDPALGTVSFHYIANPNCNDRALIPPED